MAQDTPDTHFKALQVNLDPARYGTIAEIGAGQEVARWFFRVGGAAGTIAKAMSAYDMTFSDAIYGQSDRYVSRQRLKTMLDHEYGLLIERLDGKRGDKTQFFVFADTVATRSYTRKEDGHGWLGIRFQNEPKGPASSVAADEHATRAQWPPKVIRVRRLRVFIGPPGIPIVFAQACTGRKRSIRQVGACAIPLDAARP